MGETEGLAHCGERRAAHAKENLLRGLCGCSEPGVDFVNSTGLEQAVGDVLVVSEARVEEGGAAVAGVGRGIAEVAHLSGVVRGGDLAQLAGSRLSLGVAGVKECAERGPHGLEATSLLIW